MSLGSSLSGVSFSGLGSGIDTASIVSRLVQVEAIPLQRMQIQKQTIAQKQSLYQQLRQAIAAVGTAAGALNSESAFNPIKANSSDSEVASVSADTTALAGTYNLSVSKLAQTHKISSVAKTDATTALGYSGKFVVNGEVVTVEASDTLTTIAQKVNALDAGVTASILNGGTGSTYLTFTSKKSGAKNAVQIADMEGDILSNASKLGIVTGSTAIREAISGGGTSFGFSSSTSKLGTLMGTSNQSSQTFTINGVNVSVDLDDVSLTELAAAINSAGTGATATIRSVEANGTTTYKMDLTGVTTISESGTALQSIGMLQKSYGNTMVSAQDAAFKIDGISFTNESNSITTAITGVTLNLLKADETTPKTSTLSFTRDTNEIKKKVRGLVEAYNGVVNFVRSASKLDKDTFAAGPLFGDTVSQQVEASLSEMVLGNVSGLTGDYQNLTALGFGFDQSGQLTLDEAELDSALAANPEAVSALFRAKGVSSSSALSFVSSSDKTKPSGSAGYAVNITQLATKSVVSGVSTFTSATSSPETITFGGTLFGSSAVNLSVPVGTTLSGLVDLINNDSKLRDLVVASTDNNKLVVTSKKYGSNSAFTMVSDVDGNGDGTTGVGGGSAVAGLNVAGTINGQAAEGNGQFLTAKSATTNTNADGLQIQYTGLTTGSIGSILFTKGQAAGIQELISSYTDSVSGLLTANDQSVQAQIDAIDENISLLTERVTRKEQELKERFGRLETAMAQIQQQQQQLAAMLSSNR